MGVVIGYICRRVIIRVYSRHLNPGPYLKCLGEAVYFKDSQVKWRIWLWPVAIPGLVIGWLLYGLYLLLIWLESRFRLF